MSKSAIARTKKTRFKKGQLPHNTKTDFEVTIRTDKRGMRYKFIRVSKAKWIPLQRFVYEKKYGKIPKGKKIIFLDGDPMNCEIKNLLALTSAELMKRNSIHNLPQPVAQIAQLRGALNRKINTRLKRLKNEK